MNARMVITVPIETVPDKVKDIVLSVSDKLSELSNHSYYCSIDIGDKSNLLKQLEILNDMRKKLSNIDLNIEDCYNVLKGYINYEYELQNTVEQESQNVTSDQRSGS